MEHERKKGPFMNAQPGAAGKADYAQCTRRVSKPGSWGTSPCSRAATGEDGLCSPHRRGKQARKASADRWDERWRIERAQAGFVASWRERNPYRTVADTWPCPLCGLSVFVEGGEMPSTLKTRIEQHQRFHGPDWMAYAALGEPQEP